jgi:CubicO group peptidase (beta-lactamase class C family)
VPALSVSVVKGDRLVWAKGFGVADLATGSPATLRTSYLWFSMAKIVTATAVMRLAEGGKLDLDAPADEYFRGFKVGSQPTPVTLSHLLSHSSGLANPLPIRTSLPRIRPNRARGRVPDDSLTTTGTNKCEHPRRRHWGIKLRNAEIG